MLFCVATAGAQQAGAAAITLGTASSYGVLIGTGDTLSVAGSFTLTGNLGTGQNAIINRTTTTNTVTGKAYLDSGYTTSGTGSISVTGGIVTQSMTQALADATTASNAAAALTATAGLQSQGTAINITSTPSSLAIKALSNGENVLNISSLSLANGTLTFDDNGFTGAKFIVNITGNLTVSAASTIKGITGASGADVLFNVTGSSSTISITGNSTNQIIGTILAPKANVTVGGGGTLTGNIVAGFNNVGKTNTVTAQSSGFNVTALAYTPSTNVKTPEPSTIALFGGGVVALFLIRRRPITRQ